MEKVVRNNSVDRRRPTMTKEIPRVCDSRRGLASCTWGGGVVGALVILLGIAGPELSAIPAWAQSPDSRELGRPTQGQITNVGATFIEVENRSYRLHHKLSITTEGGQPFALKDLQVGHGVQVWMSEGAVLKIIVRNPM
jgi:hypothetical protein